MSTEAAGVKYICKEIVNYGPKQTLILTQVSDQVLREDVKERFLLEVYEGSEKQPRLISKGYVITEDVMVNFVSDNKKIKTIIYLDEMEETVLTVNKKETKFDCH